MIDRGDATPGASRRAWLRAAVTLGVGSGIGGLSERWGGIGRVGRAADNGAEPSLIVRSRQPLDLETPVEVFDRFLTPNDLFFVRSHFGAPAVGLGPWRLEVRGLVERPLTLGLDDLSAMDLVSAPGVLQCTGNGRSFYSPTIPGVGWGRGAVGNAEWSGVRLVDLLRRAGLKLDEGHIHLFGADAPPMLKTPPYYRSIPLSKALDPGTVVALKMNGEPLPLLHGGPLRLIVPGWGGNHWIKWLRAITVSREEAPGFFQQSGYKMPKVPAPPGADLKPTDLVSVTTMPVKSLIARPMANARLAVGRNEVQGVAWTGEGHVDKVEVATGPNDPWQAATLLNDARPGTWRLWKWTWNAPRPGRYQLRVRATDSNGRTQPETTSWNRSGYFWNGIDTVDCEVMG